MIKINTRTDDFYKLVVYSDAFIDKSLFIKEIIDNPEAAVLITRPRRWGKSMNFDMLKRFLSIEVDSKGNKLENNTNKALFTGGEVLIEEEEYKNLLPLNISKVDNGRYMNKQGKYPVILLNLKECIGNNKHESIESIKIQIKKIFREYYYLRNSSIFSVSIKKQFDNIIEGNISEEELKDSISFLCELLYKYFNKRVWLLIDEHDKPCSYYLTLKNFNGLIDDQIHVAEFITSMIARCAKGNNYVHKTILTGVTDFIIRDGSSGLNNIQVYGIQSHKFSHSYGLSDEEVRFLLNKLNLSKNDYEQTLKHIKEWYNGYSVPESHNKKINKYNIWSVVKLINKLSEAKTPILQESYIADSKTINILKNIEEMGVCKSFIEELNKLLHDKEAVFDIPEKNYNLIGNINNIHIREKLVVYLLIQNGYLNIIDDKLKIPNLEVYYKLLKTVILIFTNNNI